MNPSAGKILVVDDDASIRRALRSTLHSMGFEIEEASTGEAALESVRNARFGVVLLDINMPGMGGIAACREIRRLLPGLAILMISVRDQAQTITSPSRSMSGNSPPGFAPQFAARMHREASQTSPSISGTSSSIPRAGWFERQGRTYT